MNRAGTEAQQRPRSRFAGFRPQSLRWRLARQLEQEYLAGLLDVDDYWRELEQLEEMSDGTLWVLGD